MTPRFQLKTVILLAFLAGEAVYQHTELRLVRRVDINASKCRVTRSRAFARSGEWIYAASCS